MGLYGQQLARFGCETGLAVKIIFKMFAGDVRKVPKKGPRHPSDQLFFIHGHWFNPKKFMHTNFHEGFCEDDDLLNPPNQSMEWVLKRFWQRPSLRWDAQFMQEILHQFISCLSHICRNSTASFETIFFDEGSAGFLPSTVLVL